VLEFSAREIAPHVREMDEQAKFPPELIRKLFDLGVMAIEVPEQFGGAGASFFHSVLAVEALARVDASVGVLVDVQNTLVINAIARWGSEDVRARFLPRLSDGTVGAYALSEAGSGSDAFALQTRAVESGDAFVLTGRKLWITNANEAGLFIVFATVDPSAGYRGITAFLVERAFPGSRSARRRTSWGSARAARASCCSRSAACRAPTCSARSARAKVAIETLNEGRIGIGAQMLGIAGGAGSLGAHTKERKQFGKAVADFRACSSSWRARPRMSRHAAARLQRGAAARRRQAVPHGSCDVQAARVGGRGAHGVARGQSLRGLRLREGLPGREAVSRREDRADLRGTSNLQLQTIAKALLA
jgi:alkylation response protein AidB-like acyl-CoA dehydrogenase